MFVLNELPPQVPKELTDLLVKAEPATIGHFLDFGFADPEVRALLPDKRIAGTVVTCRFSGVDGSIMHYALGQLRPGDVLVVDRAGDRRHAACGGGVCFAARAAGALGIIIDGMATDIGEIRQYGLPVWARGLSAVTSKRTFTHGEFCVPIHCGGVPVMPGDAVLADENGILFLKPHMIEEIAKRGIEMQAAEGPRLQRVAKGERLPDLNGTNQRIREIVAAQAKK
jgi:4-hydroxy-4-methyl-2-oxoglutarate aldolase